jgi:hypothetical protein
MAISATQQSALNNMCMTSKQAGLGDLLKALESGIGDYTLPAATTSVLGGVKQVAAQANSTATDATGLVSDFNALLAKLRTAGILANS